MAYRDALNFLSEYNLSLDTKLILGLDNEFDRAEMYNYYTNSSYSESDEAIYSQYFDLQFRPGEKSFATFGLRREIIQQLEITTLVDLQDLINLIVIQN